MTTDLLLIGVLVLLNAALSGTEMALVSLRDTQVDRLAARSAAGERLARLAANPPRYLATIQVGITLAGFGASASAAVSLAGPVEQALAPALGDAAGALAVAAVTIVLAYITLVLGELAPKRIAMQRADGWALAAARPLGWLQVLAAPAVRLLELSANAVVRLVGLDPHAQPDEVPAEELQQMVSGSATMDPYHQRVLEGAFEVADRRLGQVLTPRLRVVTLPTELPAQEGLARLAASGFSRAPVCGPAGLDDVVGVVHLRDLIEPGGTCGQRATPPVVLVESLGALDALRTLQDRRSQLGVVVDERGGVAGVVAVEDLVEELVGEIYDASDRDHQQVTVLDDGGLVAPGSFPVHDLPDFGVHLPAGPYVTLAGFVLDRLGELPEAPGVSVAEAGWQFTVTETSAWAILEVAMAPLELDEQDQ